MKRRSDDFKLDGFAGVLHSIVMFLTFPFRHIVFLVVLIAILLAMPLFYGVKFRDTWYWYKQKLPIQQVSSAASENIEALSEKKKWLQNVTHEIMPTAVPPSSKEKVKEEKKPEVRFTTWNVAKFRYAKPNSVSKATAAKTSKPFSAVKKKAQAERVIQETAEKDIRKSIGKPVTYNGHPEDYVVVRDDLPIEYLSKPQAVEGVAQVLGANSLFVGDSFVFLYGIYSHPDLYDTEAARMYLIHLVQDKNVHCEIVAYTVQSMFATAICFIDGIFINRIMVDRDLAKNVALK